MASDTYSEGTYSDRTAYTADHSGDLETTGYRDPGGIAFIWIGWTLAFAFWALTMSSFFGIISTIMSTTPAGPKGGMDGGGAAWFVMEVVGVLALAAALGWGVLRYATRDKSLDPMTEASTAALYDSVERNGGDDMVSRSPEARRPQDRDSYRPV